MSDIFREVDEDLRHERMVALWRRHGALIIGVIVAVVAIVGGWQGWRAWDQSTREGYATQFIAALDQAETDPGAAAAAFDDLAATASGGYQELAQLAAAGARRATGDVDAAIAGFDAIAAADDAPEPLRKVARLRAAAARAARGEDTSAILQPLIDYGGPFAALAREVKATEALAAGRIDAGRALLQSIVDDAAAPPGAQTRARQWLDALAPLE